MTTFHHVFHKGYISIFTWRLCLYQGCNIGKTIKFKCNRQRAWVSALKKAVNRQEYRWEWRCPYCVAAKYFSEVEYFFLFDHRAIGWVVDLSFQNRTPPNRSPAGRHTSIGYDSCMCFLTTQATQLFGIQAVQSNNYTERNDTANDIMTWMCERCAASRVKQKPSMSLEVVRNIASNLGVTMFSRWAMMWQSDTRSSGHTGVNRAAINLLSSQWQATGYKK